MPVVVSKGVTQPQNGYVDGVLLVTTEATTYSINVSAISGFQGVTSIVFASASLNSDSVVTTPPVVSWSQTGATIKISCAAAQTTASIAVRFVGK